MKKPISALLALLLLLSAAGCKEEKPFTAHDLLGSPFCCRMAIDVCGASYEGTFEKSSDKVMSFTLDKPASLNGLCFVCDGGTVSASAGGVTFPLDTEGLPCEAVTAVLFDLFGGDESKNVLSVGDEVITLRHEGKRVVSFAEFDKKTRVPQRIFTESGNVTIVLSDHQKEAP